MKKKEFKALVSLLDDDDREVVAHVEEKIIALGNEIIPYLEKEWEANFNTETQRRIEDLIHNLQFTDLKVKLASWRDSEKQDLLEGMVLVASYQYPDIDLTEIKKDLEQIYYDVWLQFKPDIHPFDQIKIINSVLFGKLKFGANNKNFHSPGNSMINVVMQSKKGNPLTICIIYLLVANKLKLPVFGVNLPNLFILTYKSKEVQFYVNAFNRGLIFTREDIDKYVGELYLTQKDAYYEPCTNMEMVTRALKNLVVAFEKIGDHYKSDEIKMLLQTLGNP